MKQTPIQISKSLGDEESSKNSFNFYVQGHDLNHFLDCELPFPSYIVPEERGYFIGWFFDGYTNTDKGIEFKNDLNEKIALLLNAEVKTRRPKYINNHFFTNNIYKLNAFTSIEDLRTNNVFDTQTKTDDYLFDLIRHRAYELKQKGILIFDNLLQYAMRVGTEMNKDNSTIRSKVKNVFKWTFHNYKIGGLKRVSKNNRADSIKIARRIKTEKKKEDLFQYFKSLKAIGINYKKESIYKIANNTKLSYMTVKKYITEYRAIKEVVSLEKRALPLNVQPILKYNAGDRDFKFIGVNEVLNYLDLERMGTNKSDEVFMDPLIA